MSAGGAGGRGGAAAAAAAAGGAGSGPAELYDAAMGVPPSKAKKLKGSRVASVIVDLQVRTGG